MATKAFIHLDGNRFNHNPSNLLEVTKQELKEFYRLKHEKISRDYTLAVMANIRLKLKIKEMEETDE